MWTTNECPSRSLLEHPVFAGSGEAVHELLSPVRPRSYAPGETIAAPGADAALHLVLGGRLRIYELTPDGRRVIFDHLDAGGVDGRLGAADQGHFAEAVEDSVVASLPPSLLDAVVRVAPPVALNLLSVMSRRLRRQERQIERMTMRDPCQRLADQLLALAEPVGDGRSWRAPRLSHETLADMLGLRRETVTLSLGRLRKAGAVRVERHHFLLDRNRLAPPRDGDADGRAG